MKKIKEWDEFDWLTFWAVVIMTGYVIMLIIVLHP